MGDPAAPASPLAAAHWAWMAVASLSMCDGTLRPPARPSIRAPSDQRPRFPFSRSPAFRPAGSGAASDRWLLGNSQGQAPASRMRRRRSSLGYRSAPHPDTGIGLPLPAMSTARCEFALSARSATNAKVGPGAGTAHGHQRANRDGGWSECTEIRGPAGPRCPRTRLPLRPY